MSKLVIVRVVSSGGGAESNLRNLNKYVCNEANASLEILTLSDYKNSLNNPIKKYFATILFMRLIRKAAKQSSSVISSVEGLPYILIFFSTIFLKTKTVLWLHCNPHTYLNKINLKQRTLIILSLYLAKKIIHASPVANEHKYLQKKETMFLTNFRSDMFISNIYEYNSIRDRLIFVGSFSNFKRPFLFVDIYKSYQLKSQNSFKTSLEFFGDGPLLSSVKSYVKEMKIPEESCKFHGHIEVPWNTIRNNTILISTSSSEALPMIFVEAISHGIPVICDNYHGSEFFTDINGLIFSCDLHNNHEIINLIHSLSNMNLQEYSDRLKVSNRFLKFYFNDSHNLKELLKFCTH